MSNLHMECKYCGEPFQVGVDRRTDSLLPPHRCRTGLVQQEEPEGVCAFPNCSCTENRCPAKGERGPFCDHGFHPRLCGRCAPVPEAVTDEDEVQCQMCKTVQPRPDQECGHCGAGPKYLCPIHTRPAAVPVQQDEPEADVCPKCEGTGYEGAGLRDSDFPCRECLGHRSVPVQQEPEDECEGCVRLNTQLDEAAKLCAELEADLIAAGGVKNPATGLPVGLCAAVPSVGLRDRVACELANLEYERSGRPCETEDFYADADRVLSVLHEAGTQDSWATFGEDMTLQREVAALNVQLVDLAESLQKAVERHQSNLRFRAEQLQDKAEAGTQELTEADRPYCPDCGMRYDEDCADCDVGDDFRAQNARFASPAEAGTQEGENA